MEGAHGQAERRTDPGDVRLHGDPGAVVEVARHDLAELHEVRLRTEHLGGHREEHRLAVEDVALHAHLGAVEVLLDQHRTGGPAEVGPGVLTDPAVGRQQFLGRVDAADVAAAGGVDRLDHGGEADVRGDGGDGRLVGQFGVPRHPQARGTGVVAHQPLVAQRGGGARRQAGQVQPVRDPGDHVHVELETGHDAHQRPLPVQFGDGLGQRDLVVGVHHEQLVDELPVVVRHVPVVAVGGGHHDLEAETVGLTEQEQARGARLDDQDPPAWQARSVGHAGSTPVGGSTGGNRCRGAARSCRAPAAGRQAPTGCLLPTVASYSSAK